MSNLTLNEINKLERKIIGKAVIRALKGFTLYILNMDMNDIRKIIKSLKDSGALTDGVAEIVNHEIKKTRRCVSRNFVSTFSLFISTTSNFFSSKRHK